MLGMRTTVLVTRFCLKSVRLHFASEYDSWHSFTGECHGFSNVHACMSETTHVDQLPAISRHSLAHESFFPFPSVTLGNLLGPLVMTLLSTLKIFVGGGGNLGLSNTAHKWSKYLTTWTSLKPVFHRRLHFFGQSDWQVLAYAKADNPILSRSFLCFVKSVIITAPLSIRKG